MKETRMEKIESAQNSFLKEIRKKTDGRGDIFLVEGYHLIEEAERYNLLDIVFSLVPYASKARNILLSPKAFASLSKQKTPEGVIGLCHKKKNSGTQSKRILYLDAVQDPGNVGTLLRTALAFNFKTVILTKDCAKAYSAKVLQASQGAIFALDIIESEKSREEDFKELENNNYQIITTSLQGNDYFNEETFDKNDKICLVLGNEGNGVSQEAIAHAKILLRIPIEHIDSLNVGVAGGIFMYLLRL